MKWLTVSAALMFCCAATSDANAFFHHSNGCGCGTSCCAPAPSCCAPAPSLLRSGSDLLRSGPGSGSCPSCCASGPGSCSVVLRSGPGSGCSQLLRSGPDLRLQRGSQLRLWLQCGS